MGIKLVVVGAAGRMGRRIIALAMESGRFALVGAVDAASHPDAGKDAGVLAGVGTLGVKVSEEWPAGADVVIDFSLPQAADATIEWCAKHGVALVMGTTGLSDAQKAALRAAGRKTAVVYATNMSVGMNVLFALVGKAAAMLSEAYDIEIIEQHHRFKKDAPSGSAMTLAESICEATGRDVKTALVHGRSGLAPRKPGEIGMHAVRAGDITGVHSVMYAALGDMVTLSHTAQSRDTFVQGALRAAKWLQGQRPGLYSMRDVLGIE